MRKSMLSGMSAGQISPEKAVGFLVPKEDQANATKELKDVQSTAALRDNALDNFDKLTKN